MPLSLRIRGNLRFLQEGESYVDVPLSLVLGPLAAFFAFGSACLLWLTMLEHLARWGGDLSGWTMYQKRLVHSLSGGTAALLTVCILTACSAGATTIVSEAFCCLLFATALQWFIDCEFRSGAKAALSSLLSAARARLVPNSAGQSEQPVATTRTSPCSVRCGNSASPPGARPARVNGH